MTSRITHQPAKKMDVSIMVGNKYSSVDLHVDFQMENVVAPPRALQVPPGLARQKLYDYV